MQTALSLARPGDQIWVAAGTYKPDYDVATGQHTGARSATFQLLSGVGIYGGFAGSETTPAQRAGLFDQTILTGDLANDDPNISENSYHVVTGSIRNPTAVLDGFTITGGNATSVDNGGGMYNMNGSPTVTNCTFRRNYASRGGGIYNGGSSSPTVTFCTFDKNAAIADRYSTSARYGGGGMYNAGSSSPTVTHCTFKENSAIGPLSYGGGMYNDSVGDRVVTNCVFRGNSSERGGGGGMFNGSHSDVVVTNCVFRGNSSDRGGGMFNGSLSDVVVTNCVFRLNAGEDGGGIYNRSRSTTAINCTISDNSAVNGGGIYNTVDANILVSNCIVWQNVDGGAVPVLAQIRGSSAVNYSIVHGGWSGVGGLGVLNADPLFVNPAGGDLRLRPGSPAIDGGNNAVVPEDVMTDLDGNPRIVDGNGDGQAIVDMGAYEF